MEYKFFIDKYEKGKQVISVFVIILSVIASITDTLIYFNVYTTTIFLVQYSTIFAGMILLILFFMNREKYYRLAYGITSYLVIVNIILTTIFYPYFQETNVLYQSNVGARDLYFIFIYVVISGFVIGRRHIIAQGLFLNFLIFYYALILKDPFFMVNAIVYLISTNGFLLVIYMLIRFFSNFNKGIKQVVLDEARIKKNALLKGLKLEKYQKSLLEITKGDLLYNNSTETIFETLCSTAARKLKTNRVSLWFADENFEKITRKFLYEQDVSTHEGMDLYKKDFPLYFEALMSSPYIKAVDAVKNPNTSEFKDAYLKPLNIRSMLDCPILIDGKVVGIICCEHRKDIREWQSEDILYVQGIADFIALGFKNQQIKMLLEKIKVQNNELLSKNHEIEAMNEELTVLNDELKNINDSLELTVKERTSELENQNAQLSEYAFINSHLLRAPLARILGLSYLIEEQVNSGEKDLIKALIASTQELDSIVKRITQILYEGHDLKREAVQDIISRRLHQNGESEEEIQ